MARNRSSAKAAGARFERTVADYLASTVDDRIDRRVKSGAKDKGDLASVRLTDGRRVVVECKDYGGRFEVSTWLSEAETERVNDGADVGLVVAKRRGTTQPGDQVVFMTLETLSKILSPGA